jgi:hypothetical protein
MGKFAMFVFPRHMDLKKSSSNGDAETIYRV